MTEPWFKWRLAVLATMHSKEQVIAPVLEDALGLRVEVLREIEHRPFRHFHDRSRVPARNVRRLA